MNYKRGRCRRKIRCTLCTPHRVGNSKDWGNPKRYKQSASQRNQIHCDDSD